MKRMRWNNSFIKYWGGDKIELFFNVQLLREEFFDEHLCDMRTMTFLIEGQIINRIESYYEKFIKSNLDLELSPNK